MGRVRCVQASFAFRSSGSEAARLPIEMGQTCGKMLRACGAPLLDRDGKLHGVIALLAFERAHVEARLSGHNAGKPHWLAALGARKDADIGDAKEWFGLSCGHDASLCLGGSMQHSQSPIKAIGLGDDVKQSYMPGPDILVNIAHSAKILCTAVENRGGIEGCARDLDGAYKRSRASLARPQCGSLRDELNSRTT
jgi:hypothetical protein